MEFVGWRCEDAVGTQQPVLGLAEDRNHTVVLQTTNGTSGADQHRIGVQSVGQLLTVLSQFLQQKRILRAVPAERRLGLRGPPHL